MPLSWAAENMQETVIQALLENGADIDESKDRAGRTTLPWAAGIGCVAVVQVLLENGANI
jgi:ankyrin repeat protein